MNLYESFCPCTYPSRLVHIVIHPSRSSLQYPSHPVCVVGRERRSGRQTASLSAELAERYSVNAKVQRGGGGGGGAGGFPIDLSEPIPTAVGRCRGAIHIHNMYVCMYERGGVGGGGKEEPPGEAEELFPVMAMTRSMPS